MSLHITDNFSKTVSLKCIYKWYQSVLYYAVTVLLEYIACLLQLAICSIIAFYIILLCLMPSVTHYAQKLQNDIIF